jgi:hypothetical protein
MSRHCSVFLSIEEVLAAENFRPKREDRLRPSRLMILDGVSVDGTVLAVHLDEDEVVLEDLAGKRGTHRGIQRILLADPNCFDKLTKGIRDVWKRMPLDILLGSRSDSQSGPNGFVE